MSEGGSDYDENIVEERMSGQEEEEEEDNDVDHMVEEKPEAGDNQNQNEENETTKGAVTINQKIGDRTCATYTFKGEDHTLGNLLRYALIKNPDVEFCGYSITHPSENEMNLRLQTTGKSSFRSDFGFFVSCDFE